MRGPPPQFLVAQGTRIQSCGKTGFRAIGAAALGHSCLWSLQVYNGLQWYTVGIQLVHGINLVYIWYTVGIQLVYSWNTVGIQLEYNGIQWYINI